MHESEIFRSFRDPKLPNERFYYVSWYMKYHVPGEGTELIYLFPKSTPSTEPSRVFLAYLEISMTHDSYDSPCLYPPSGAFHLANADRILRFDANGRRIGDPDWPIRMTVMAIVFEAIQVVGEKFGLRLSQSEGFESQVLGCKYADDLEIVSYSPHFRQFDLLDDSKPLFYTRYVVPGLNATLFQYAQNVGSFPIAICYL